MEDLGLQVHIKLLLLLVSIYPKWFRQSAAFLYCLITFHQLIYYNWSQMESKNEIWENLTSKNNQPAKTYAINSCKTALSHLYAHQIIISETTSKTESLSYLTLATFDCDFALLEGRPQGQLFSDAEFKEVLRVRTDYPIMHCLLEYTFEAKINRYLLVGYLIDIYSTIYTIYFTDAIDLTQKYPGHPIQFTTLTQTFRNEASLPREDLLYLETPLFIKKCGSNIVSLNLKGQILVLDLTQSHSSIKHNDLSFHKESLGKAALAAAHNRIRCKYENVIVVATANGRTPYVFVNCTSTAEFENQRSVQDTYEWLDEALEATYCTVDPATSLVCVGTVAQTIDIYEIMEVKSSRNFHFLRKKFAFFVSNNLHFSNINIESNIQNIHAGKGLLMITTSKEHIIFDLKELSIRKRAKGSNISMLKWGQIIDRKGNAVSIALAKGYNHFNDAQSKIGKPNVHFKVQQLK